MRPMTLERETPSVRFVTPCAKTPCRCDNRTVTSAPTSQHLTVRDGTALRALQWSVPNESPGIPIVLIHGLASNSRLWDGPARLLSQMGHAVVAIDLRGHGLSDKPDHGYAMSDIATDVSDVLDALEQQQRKWANPLIIGQSWGGNIVVEVAHSFGHKIRGAVAVDGGTIELQKAFPVWEECKRALTPPALAGMSYERLRSYIRAAHLDWSEEAIDGQMYNMEHLADGTIKPWLTLERHLTVLRGLWEHSPSLLWNEISVPILFTPAARGNDEHTVVKRSQVQQALDHLQQSRVEWFDPADHDLHAQFPDRFAAVVNDAITSGFFS